jgi:hypothetical protein
MHKGLIACLLLVALFAAGCASPAYREVFKEDASYNARDFSEPPDVLFQSVSRVLLGRNFILDKEEQEKGFILARRCFQKGKKTDALIVQAKIMPASDGISTLYLNAVQTTDVCYIADRTRFLLFLIPLPGGGGKEASTVKQGEKIINDKKFYADFFNAIKDELGRLRSHASKAEPAGVITDNEALATVE